MSGFAPGVTRRNSFIRLSSPKTTEELLCSPLSIVDRASTSISGVADPVEHDVSGCLAGGEALQPQRRRGVVVQGVVGPDLAELVVVPVPDQGVLEPRPAPRGSSDSGTW